MSPLRLIAGALAAVFFTGAALAQDLGAEEALRSSAVLNGPQPAIEVVPADPIPRWVTDDQRLMRQYPEQPPLIPHSIEGYQLTVNANRCMSCHRREATEGSGAPMISVTHFMDREGQTLGTVSPRRYFCTQCHVVQHDAEPPVVNGFVDVDSVLDHMQGAVTGGE